MSVEPEPAEEAQPERLTGPREALRVATQRNFGPYFLGNALSASGTWFQNLAASLLVFRLTHSPFLLGVLNFAQFVPVSDLSRVVTRADIEAADWSLTPGRYVGVAPPEVDEDFDFEQVLRDIHVELADLNKEAATLAAKIQENFEGLGI